MNNKVIYLLSMILIFAGGASVGLWFAPADDNAATATKQDGGKGKGEPLFYRSPMNPAVTSPVPAKDDMGMDYIPVYAGGAQNQVPGTVTIDPVTVQAIGVRTAKATKEPLSRIVRAPGRVDYDEETMNRLHPKTQGWIEELRVDKTGEFVEQDDILLSIYSQNLVTSQEEYLLALQALENAEKVRSKQAIQSAMQIANSARQRLVLLDVPEHQIVELEQTREVKRTLHIHSPFSGIVTKIGVREGQFVTPGTELYRIADLSEVWVYVDVYEHELPWIKVGDKAEMEVAAVPGRTFTGEITYIYPYMEPKSRTVRVRLEFPNEDELLKPDMFANVNIFSNTQEAAIVVPSEAIVRSGTREQVFVARGEGKFEPRKVTVGLESRGLAQILDGVRTGERVVTSAQFLIDSESKLNEATAKMLEADGGMEGMDRGDHDMQNMEGKDHGDDDMQNMEGMEGMDHGDHDMQNMEGMEGMDHGDHDMEDMKDADSGTKGHGMEDMGGMDMEDLDIKGNGS